MIPLTIIVDSLGGWLALGFILVFIVKAFLSAIGGDVDIDTDVDTETVSEDGTLAGINGQVENVESLKAAEEAAAAEAAAAEAEAAEAAEAESEAESTVEQ